MGGSGFPWDEVQADNPGMKTEAHSPRRVNTEVPADLEVVDLVSLTARVVPGTQEVSGTRA